jgi:branched-subunit amino acid aminotransferase/4-amino-4-deoxychorismate lyase
MCARSPGVARRGHGACRRAATPCGSRSRLGLGNYYGDAKTKGAKLDIAKWRAPRRDAPYRAKAAGLYMIATMSKHAAEAKGCSDALMMDYRGYVAEATGANIFFVKDGEVHTPKPTASSTASPGRR